MKKAVQYNLSKGVRIKYPKKQQNTKNTRAWKNNWKKDPKILNHTAKTTPI